MTAPQSGSEASEPATSEPGDETTTAGEHRAARPGLEDGPEAATTSRVARRIAALFVLPYLLLMVSWAVSNPPGAAPDESDHLVKAIATARLEIGKPLRTDLAAVPDVLVRRNASSSRIVSIPAQLQPNGYSCTAFRSDRSASCLPKTLPTGSGDVKAVTTVGTYPPFMYVATGLAARLMDTPARAFLAGRIVCVVMASVLMYLGAYQLVRWLGSRALLGAFLALTPMALFASAMVSTSGVEICGAFAVACVGIVAFRRPRSLLGPSLLPTFAVAGAALVMSRQLGALTFGAVGLLALARLGRHRVVELFRRHSVPFVGSFVFLVVTLGAALYWNQRYDRTTDIGPTFSEGAFDSFVPRAFNYVRGGVGVFGWLDTPVPQWIVLTWVLLTVSVVAVAVLLGRTADRWSLVGWLLATMLVAYVVYAKVFFPVHADLQARHLLPFFQFAPLLAGVLLVDNLESTMPDVMHRVFRLAAVAVPAIQFGGLYINARRYAVGTDGPLNFLGHSQWSPKFGWTPWLALGAIAAIVLCLVILRSAAPQRTAPRSMPFRRKALTA